VSHLGLAPALRPNVTLRYYEAGHMMYTHEADHRKLRSDLVNFFRTVLP
jgi:carboxypeptidase C (cathepsin A)